MIKLAILGASYFQQPLVEKANQMGIETHCFAWDNEDAICKKTANYFYPISVLDKEEILKKCEEVGVDGITTIATDICIPTISYVAEKLNLISNSYVTAISATNKSKMREQFQENQISSPRNITVEKYEAELFNSFDFPLIVKPTDRSGSRGVTKVYDIEKLEGAIQNANQESIEKKVIVEEFIEGSEISVETISWQGQHYVLAITDKITTEAPHFVELQHHQPSTLSETMQKAIEIETIKVLNALGIQYGASHSEFKITKENKIIVIEVGARMGGDFIGSHLVQLSTGYDFLKGVVDISLNQFQIPILKDFKFSGVYFLSKESERLLPYFEKDNSFDFEKKVLKTELCFIENSNHRSGYLIYQSSKKVIL